MNEIYIIAKLGSQILIVNRDDLPKIGKSEALEIKSLTVDFSKREISEIVGLEERLKFSPWIEINDHERMVAQNKLTETFDIDEFQRKIVAPLSLDLSK